MKDSGRLDIVNEEARVCCVFLQKTVKSIYIQSIYIVCSE